MIVVVGEALVDVVEHEPDGETTESPGGSPYNVAVGLARLGVDTELITQVGHDERAATLVEHARSSGVRVMAAPTATGRTATARAVLDRGQASYRFDLEWTLPHEDLPRCEILHVGSLGTTLEPGRRTVLDLVAQAERHGQPVSYDPNIRPEFLTEDSWAQVCALGGRCDVVKLSVEDARLLRSDLRPDEVARVLLEGEHTQLVLLTEGPMGATAYVEGLEVSRQPRQIDLVDTVGAGDAFMSAVLAQLHDTGWLRHESRALPREEEGLGRLLEAAMEVAALTCERRGADPPYRKQLPRHWPA